VSFTTLAIVHAPTLADGLVQLLRLGDALQLAGQDCGVTVYRDTTGRLAEAEADYELPAGVLEYVQRVPVEPFTDDQLGTTSQLAEREARRELLELLAHATHVDIVATADRVAYL
jgi:hypothetical protein